MTDGQFAFSLALVYFKKLSTARSAKLPDARFRQSMTRLKMVPSTSFSQIRTRHKTPMPSFCITSSEAGKGDAALIRAVQAQSVDNSGERCDIKWRRT